MALDPGAMHDRIIENLPHKTGHALDHWRAVADATEGDRKARLAGLKAAGLGHHTAVAVLREVEDDVPWRRGGDLEADLTARLSAPALALYRALRARAEGLSGTVVVPCKSYTGFKAGRQFAVIRPKGDGLEVGLALDPASDPALAPAGALGSARIAAVAPGDLGADALGRLIERAHREA